MIRILSGGVLRPLYSSFVKPTFKYHFSSEANKTCDPLRILFCGSDAFSIHSLRALLSLQQRDGKLVESIDVVCRTDKRVGRGRYLTSEVPIKSFAKDKNLPIHQLDDFRGFDVNKDINLIIAVSFGLLIPANLINHAKYGGLNVHPSFLPDLRGAAPLHHTLLLGRPVAGVTVQTLHPTRFDHGILLAQTPLPGFSIAYHPAPVPTTVSQLAETLGKEGSRLLTRVLETRAFVQPLEPLLPFVHEDFLFVTEEKGLAKAPKVKKEDSRVSWRQDGTDDVLRRLLVFERVWDEETHGLFNSPGKEKVRVLYDAMRELEDQEMKSLCQNWEKHGRPEIGRPFLLGFGAKKRVAIRLKDDRVVEILSCTAAGRTKAKITDGRYGVGLLVGWIENLQSRI